jgi:hypothetical protein
MIGDDDCGEIGGMKISKGNRSLGENLPQRHFVHHIVTYVKVVAVEAGTLNIVPDQIL